MIGNRKFRKQIGERNGLKIYTKLEGRTQLKSKTPMKQITEKQKGLNKNWRTITDEVCEEEHYICRWCGLIGTRSFEDLNRLEGHHIIPRRYNIHTKENCYPAHNLTCHDFITDHSIDVRIYKTKKEWENRNEQ
jgi:hypothetical protein